MFHQQVWPLKLSNEECHLRNLVIMIFFDRTLFALQASRRVSRMGSQNCFSCLSLFPPYLHKKGGKSKWNSLQAPSTNFLGFLGGNPGYPPFSTLHQLHRLHQQAYYSFPVFTLCDNCLYLPLTDLNMNIKDDLLSQDSWCPNRSI